MPRLAELKEEAQRHYAVPLKWTDVPTFPGGHAWAEVDHHIVSVMAQPPAGNSQIVIIRDGKQEPLGPIDMFAIAYEMAFEL